MRNAMRLAADLTDRMGLPLALCALLLAIGALSKALQAGQWVQAFWAGVGIFGAALSMGLLEGDE